MAIASCWKESQSPAAMTALEGTHRVFQCVPCCQGYGKGFFRGINKLILAEVAHLSWNGLVNGLQSKPAADLR